MSAPSIGGPLDWALLYGRRDLYRPTDPTLIAAEVRRMHRDGLKVRDIADSLRIGVAAVTQALREHP
jgi:hypothetical protein